MVQQSATDRSPWRSYLRDDPVPWLLEPANPSARYLTLRYVLGWPEDDRDVAEAWAGILEADPAASILAAQWPDGYWVTPDRGYTPRYRATVWQILFLAQLGAPRDERIERACEFVWQHSRLDNGLFTPHRRPSLTDLALLNGNLMWALTHFGYAGDPRMEQVLTALARLDLARLFETGCLGAVVRLVHGAQALPEDLIRPLGSFLDDATGHILHHLPAENAAAGREPEFQFPLAEETDLLEMVAVLQHGDGVAGASRVRWALDLIIQAQDQCGRWPLGAVPGKMWTSFGMQGHANKWVTIRALRVLQAMGQVR